MGQTIARTKSQNSESTEILQEAMPMKCPDAPLESPIFPAFVVANAMWPGRERWIQMMWFFPRDLAMLTTAYLSPPVLDVGSFFERMDESDEYRLWVVDETFPSEDAVRSHLCG